MELRLSPESFLFFSAIALGFCFGIYYECFRFLRLALSHSFFLIIMEDLLFFLPVTLICIFFHYALSDGVIRWFSVAGIVMGFLLYLGTLGKILLFFSSAILNSIRRLFRGIWRICFCPVLNVFKNITICLYAKGKTKIIIVKKRRSAHQLAKQKKTVLQRAKKGFSK